MAAQCVQRQRARHAAHNSSRVRQNAAKCLRALFSNNRVPYTRQVLVEEEGGGATAAVQYGVARWQPRSGMAKGGSATGIAVRCEGQVVGRDSEYARGGGGRRGGESSGEEVRDPVYQQ